MIYFDGSDRSVAEGPFIDAKELVAGFWLIPKAAIDVIRAPKHVQRLLPPILLKNSLPRIGFSKVVDESAFLAHRSTKLRQNRTDFVRSMNPSEVFNGIGRKRAIRTLELGQTAKRPSGTLSGVKLDSTGVEINGPKLSLDVNMHIVLVVIALL